MINCSIQTLLLPVLQFDFQQEHVRPFLNINPTQETLGSLVLVLQSSPTSSGVLIIPKFPKVSKQKSGQLAENLPWPGLQRHGIVLPAAPWPCEAMAH